MSAVGIEQQDNYLRTQVVLTFACENIPSKDLLSASDPLLVLSVLSGNKWVKYGRTECIPNNPNPKFNQVLTVDYYFEREQKFRCDIYDIDSSNLDDLASHDHIGYCEFTLGRLMSSPSTTMKIILKKPNGEERSKAKVIIRGDEQKNNNDYALVDIQASNLKKKSLLFGKDDTYLSFIRQREDKQEVIIHRTEIVMDSQSPHWKPFKISMGALTNCDSNAVVILRVSHQREGLSTSKHQVIGEIKVSVNDLLYPEGSNRPPPTFNLLSAKDNGSVGQLKINKFHVQTQYSFLQYLSGKLDLRLVVAIDFTSSNGNPTHPNSLHHISSGHTPNEYENAINSVGSILSSYIQKDTFPSFGFGASVPGINAISHCFPLDLGAAVSFPDGVQGLLAKYHFALNRVALAGPTYFSQILNTVEGMINEPYTQDFQHYTILLILTDGAINDMQETIKSLVRCSEKPLSVVIVGVGSADYTNMNLLDADTEPLRSGTSVAKRDIVQFVPFRETFSKGYEYFTKEVLQEIPNQVVEFMSLHKIAPLSPKAIGDDNSLNTQVSTYM